MSFLNITFLGVSLLFFQWSECSVLSRNMGRKISSSYMRFKIEPNLVHKRHITGVEETLAFGVVTTVLASPMAPVVAGVALVVGGAELVAPGSLKKLANYVMGLSTEMPNEKSLFRRTAANLYDHYIPDLHVAPAAPIQDGSLTKAGYKYLYHKYLEDKCLWQEAFEIRAGIRLPDVATTYIPLIADQRAKQLPVTVVNAHTPVAPVVTVATTSQQAITQMAPPHPAAIASPYAGECVAKLPISPIAQNNNTLAQAQQATAVSVSTAGTARDAVKAIATPPIHVIPPNPLPIRPTVKPIEAMKDIPLGCGQIESPISNVPTGFTPPPPKPTHTGPSSADVVGATGVGLVETEAGRGLLQHLGDYVKPAWETCTANPYTCAALVGGAAAMSVGTWAWHRYRYSSTPQPDTSLYNAADGQVAIPDLSPVIDTGTQAEVEAIRHSIISSGRKPTVAEAKSLGFRGDAVDEVKELNKATGLIKLNTELSGGAERAQQVLDTVRKEFSNRKLIAQQIESTKNGSQRIVYIFEDGSRVQLRPSGGSGHPKIDIKDVLKNTYEKITFT